MLIIVEYSKGLSALEYNQFVFTVLILKKKLFLLQVKCYQLYGITSEQSAC